MAIDLYDSRQMIRQLEQMKPPRNFLRDTFFTEVNNSDTDTIDIDVVKGKRRVAPYVSPKIAGKVVERLGYETHTVKPAYVKPKMVTETDDILKRQPGVTIYEGAMTPLQRAAMQLGKDLAELNEMIDRLEEIQAAEALDTGKVSISGEGVEYVVDYQMDASHQVTLAGGDLWSDAASDPFQDLRTWRRLIIKDSGITPDIVIMAADVVDIFLNHAKISATLDNRRIDRGYIRPDLLPNGVTYLGYIFETGCDFYSYDEWYVDGNGDEQAMLPEKKVWMGSARARAVRHYGVIKDLEWGEFAVRRFPKSWVQKDPSARFLLLQSAPLLALHQVDAFVSAQVLA